MFWESRLTVLLKVHVFSARYQNCLKKTKFRGKFSHLFFYAQWSVVWHTWLNNFAKRQRNHSNSKNDNRKKKLSRKTNPFSSKPFSGSAKSCCKNPEEKFLTKALFFHLEVRICLQTCSISKKKSNFLQNFLKVLRLQFWQPCR